MDFAPPSYISAPTHYVSHAPERYTGDDVTLHLSYNVLLPQEAEEIKRAMCLWINTKDSEFPFVSKEQMDFFDRIDANRCPDKALSGAFAFIIEQELKKGKTTVEAAEIAFLFAEEEMVSRYFQHAKEIAALENTTQDADLKVVYQTLKEALVRVATNPREALKNYYTQRIWAYKDDPEMLDLLLSGSIGRHPMDPDAISPLRPCDYWQQRRKSLFQTIDKVRQLAPNAPFILAVQEVNPHMLTDFKNHFESEEAHIISYNNGTGKKTDEPLADNEMQYKKELTSTLILSKEFDVIREELETLPSTSGGPRRILGVEVLNKKTGKPLAIFTAHADHIPSKQLYVNTAAKIHEFVGQFLKKSEIENLPFVFSGDLNTFPDAIDATYLVETLRNEGAFKGSHDYREGSSFHVPSAIAHSTFIGHPIDDFKALIGKDGTVRPNALDHSYISGDLKPIWGMRDAGAYDDLGNYVDPYENPELYIESIKKRQTASDHLLNAFIFK
jgi:endonuclease/exonuclease/phosphatase family metal-dependent hydrolase